MATKPKPAKPADDACQAKLGTQQQQDPAGKDKGRVDEVEHQDEDEDEGE